LLEVGFLVTHVPTSTYAIRSSYLEGKGVSATHEHVLKPEQHRDPVFYWHEKITS